ncbi:MAG: FecR family protein [Cyclobacteriaceae bacterium]
MTHDYSHYKTEDFLTDERFRQWVFASTTQGDSYWQSVLAAHPDQKANIHQAREILLSLQQQWPSPKPGMMEADWQKITRVIESEALSVEQPSYRFPVFWRVAASILLILGIGGLLWWNVQSLELQLYTTDFAQTQQITLPDGSSVSLNANSSLRFDTEWEKDGSREVWLDGEAYFDVDQIENSQIKGQKLKFIVHTPALDVEVIGTSFNVNSRDTRTQVTLNSGKVVVKGIGDQAIEMKPGEQVELHHESEMLTLKQVNTSNYTSWKQQRLEFENLPVDEILTMLRDRYGWEFSISDSTFLDSRYTGSVSSTRPEIILDKLSLLYSLQIEKQEKQITINPK